METTFDSKPLASPNLQWPEIPPASDQAVIEYLRYAGKFSEVAALAEQDQLILQLCNNLSVNITDQELQTAGDEFRLAHQLMGAPETFAWLQQQRITVEDWSQGIRVRLLTQKLQEHLFGAGVDAHYLQHRDRYRRAALSQILVRSAAEAVDVIQRLQQPGASFCALALAHSQGKQTRENGGFAGVRFLAELIPQLATAIAEVEVGEVVGPVQTQLGYHILRVEQWFPAELNEAVRTQILDALFQSWLQGAQ